MIYSIIIIIIDFLKIFLIDLFLNRKDNIRMTDSFNIRQSNNVPKYRLEDLYNDYKNTKSKNTKSSTFFHHKSSKKPTHSMMESVEVKSPFYQRNSGSKFNCKCPFHSYHGYKSTSCHRHHCSNQLMHPKTKQNKVSMQETKLQSNWRKKIVKTQSQQRVNKHSDNIGDSQTYKNNTVQTESQSNYEHIGHRVNCRNYEFQKFLQNNYLCILKETSLDMERSKQMNSSNDLCEGLLSNFSNFDNIGDMLSLKKKNVEILYNKNDKQKLKRMNAQSSHKYQKKHKTHILTREQLDKLKALVKVIKSKKVHMKVENIQNLINFVTKCAESQLNMYGNTAIYREIMKVTSDLKEIKNIILQQEREKQKNRISTLSNQTIQKHRRESKQSSTYLSKKSINSKSRKDLNSQSGGSNQFVLKKNYKKKQSIFRSQKQNNINTENNQKINERQSSCNFKNLKNSKTSIIDSEKHIKNEKMKNVNIGRSHISKLPKTSKNSNFWREQNLKSEQDSNLKNLKNQISTNSEDLIETINLAGIRYSRFDFLSKEREKIKELQLKKKKQIQEHLRKKAQQAEYQAQILKKKYIEKYKTFFRKVHKKMKDMDLGIFVINDGDSLITQKKKMRYLKQLVSRAKNNASENSTKNYQEIAKYIQVYAEHCNLILGKQLHKLKNTDFDDESLGQSFEPDLGNLMTTKDLSNSMKFISLQQNQTLQIQQKVDGWIAISQFTTINNNKRSYEDKYTVNNKQVRQQNLNQNKQIIQIKNNQEESQQSSRGSLKQCQLPQNGQVYYFNSKQKSKNSSLQLIELDDDKKQQKFLQKIEMYRQKIIHHQFYHKNFKNRTST